MTINGKPYKVWRYEEILKEQLLIGFLSQGSCQADFTNDLPVNDRRILLSTLQQVENEKSKKREELRAQRQARRNTKRL